MSYDFHITRRDHWADAGSDILVEEWKAYVEASPDLLPDGSAHRNVGSPIGFTDAVWTGHSKNGADGSNVSFIYYNGDITTNYPDHETVRKMMEIAVYFGANGQTDDGERIEGNAIYER